MLDYDSISKELLNRGYQVASENSKTIRYENSISGLSVFLKVQTNKQPLVIHPDNQSRFSQFHSICGVDCPLPMKFYHNSTMRAFPERLNEGEAPTKYGLAFGFETSAALQNFIDVLEKRIPTTLLQDLEAIEQEDLPQTEKLELRKARVGQGKFRDFLLEEFDGRCPVTGVTQPELLRASHIKPWRNCDTALERLDLKNGLLLAANVDALFDIGFISFDPNGKMMRSKFLDDHSLKGFGLTSTVKLNIKSSTRSAYMEHHRKHIFKT